MDPIGGRRRLAQVGAVIPKPDDFDLQAGSFQAFIPIRQVGWLEVILFQKGEVVLDGEGQDGEVVLPHWGGGPTCSTKSG
jgi:hypothetical protein